MTSIHDQLENVERGYAKVSITAPIPHNVNRSHLSELLDQIDGEEVLPEDVELIVLRSVSLVEVKGLLIAYAQNMGNAGGPIIHGQPTILTSRAITISSDDLDIASCDDPGSLDRLADAARALGGSVSVVIDSE